MCRVPGGSCNQACEPLGLPLRGWVFPAQVESKKKKRKKRIEDCITRRIQSKNLFVLENFLRKELASIMYQLEDSFYFGCFFSGF
jgi:hypothetical protein